MERHGFSRVRQRGSHVMMQRRTVESTIRIPAGRIPQELRATILNSAPPTNVLGEVVQAIFKVEGQKLILATGGDGDGGPPKSFDASADTGMTRYELIKSRLPSDSVAVPDGR